MSAYCLMSSASPSFAASGSGMGSCSQAASSSGVQTLLSAKTTRPMLSLKPRVVESGRYTGDSCPKKTSRGAMRSRY